MPSQQFESFLTQLGLRKEIADALWDADIHTPQELAGMDSAQLRKVSNFPLLVDNIHPILQKYVFNIAMAKDPYKKALAVVKKHAVMDDDEEPMEQSPSISADSTVSDAVPTGNANSGSTRPSRASTNQQPLAPKNNASMYTNRSTFMNTSGGNMTQTHIGFSSSPAQKPNGSGHSITIAGGNFVQANILGTGPVTYNNTNSVISTTSVPDVDLKKRRARLMNESLFINGTIVKASDLRWMDNVNYWIDNIALPRSDIETYTEHMASDDIYGVRNHGSSRALILNNIHFRGNGMSTRTGADMDCQRMEDLLKQLGFKVRRENDKTAAEMRELLREFAESQENMKADMSVVYIGSHGERDAHGNDTFVGSDEERVSFSEVKKMFSPSKCRLLNGKPKMFFLQFCRQENGRNPIPPAAPIQQSGRVFSDAETFPSTKGNERTAAASAVEETLPMDMLFVYATLAGSKAYRDTQDGSWFVTALVRVFTDHANKEDLLSMLTKVNNSVSVNEGYENDSRALQMSEVVNTLRKKVFFYPGLGV